MAAAPPYMASVKNLPSIFARIQEAGAPPRFTYEFLKSALGFASSQDRGVIAVLKQLGFLASDGTPTQRYNDFRSGPGGGRALADGLREGWSDVFLADQRAHEKTTGQLKELFKSVTGKSEAVAEKMASTFKALADKANWSISPPGPAEAVTEAVPLRRVEAQERTTQDHRNGSSP
jgi:hypothetical protein